MSSAEVVESLLDLSHDFVDLEWLQKGRFLFQLCTPCRQDPVHSCLLVIAFIKNLLDGHFPFLKTHRLFLLEFDFVRHTQNASVIPPHCIGVTAQRDRIPYSVLFPLDLQAAATRLVLEQAKAWVKMCGGDGTGPPVARVFGSGPSWVTSNHPSCSSRCGRSPICSRNISVGRFRDRRPRRS